MWAIELEGPDESGGDRECEEGEIDRCRYLRCALCDKNGYDSDDDKVIGPDEAEEITRWLP